ncbi:aldehyde dehydrogenase family protein [Sneathiella sp. CAU 1612]|uniref:Aldehyde dehydrogenase family protein n=1 Tax=Sneathiella sedimenti TaxID=2816034 RepID=A0ABS3F6R9_9PROT|nr:aldehyde dehydrogenase family protein [Sneathiella sedimenti]MBO0334205.1 aldehyde dehydrogenase family protein [Sneathiella sedimenti]
MSIAEIFDNMDYGPAPESNAAALQWIAERKGKFDLFINGDWIKPKSKNWFESRNPATGKALAKIAAGNAKDIDAAVSAARAAQKGWSTLGGPARARYLYALARAIQRNSRLLAVLETLDNGKPVRETRDIDMPLVARHFYHHAGWAQLQDQEFGDFEPMGVIGQIIPWNFPLLMLAWKIAPAIAAGNTVILKPAEYTSLTALCFAEICKDVGLPDGVVNIVTGDGATGEALVKHPDIDKIAFTGSTEVGRLIRKATAGSGKHLTLELGGKSPFIVFDDADIDSTVEGVVDAIWFNQGQVCCAGSRLLLQEGIAERMTAKLQKRMEALRIGDPLDKSIDMGAIVDPTQLATIKNLVKKGAAEGGTVWQPKCDLPEGGCFYPPTLISDVAPASTVAQEEIFGPVIVSMTFRTPDEAVAIANNTRYGLAASVWSENINLALDVAPKLDCGVVWVNTTNQFDAACGFGGNRESGYGREGGHEGMKEVLKPKFLSKLPPYKETKASMHKDYGSSASLANLDRTPKLYIGGKQARPDSGYSMPAFSAKGEKIGDVGEGNRKDIRNAVEAARKATGWSKASSHNRAQVLYYLAENLDIRKAEFADRLKIMTGVSAKKAQAEVDATIQRLFSYGAWTDKYESAVHSPPMRGVTLAMKEPIGTLGIVCPDEAPLLSMISLAAPALAMGNRIVLIASERHPLAATDFYQVLETSDVPAGAMNIITGPRDSLAKTLAEHDDVKSVWYFGPLDGSKLVEAASTGNMKRTWVNNGKVRDWFNITEGEGREFLHHATQIKNIWIPYGE